MTINSSSIGGCEGADDAIYSVLRGPKRKGRRWHEKEKPFKADDGTPVFTSLEDSAFLLVLEQMYHELY